MGLFLARKAPTKRIRKVSFLRQSRKNETDFGVFPWSAKKTEAGLVVEITTSSLVFSPYCPCGAVRENAVEVVISTTSKSSKSLKQNEFRRNEIAIIYIRLKSEH